MLRIEVPALPPKECNPNWRGHWSERQRASNEFKRSVFYCAIDARNRDEEAILRRKSGEYYTFDKAKIDLTFIFPTIRGRDEDNLRAQFKPGLDALVMANFILDDTPEYLVTGDIKVDVDKDRAPMTVIELTEAGQ